MKATVWLVLVTSYSACGLIGNGNNKHTQQGDVIIGKKYIHRSLECPVNDESCERDKLGFEAIRHLHLQIDDDRNGNLDRSESDEFIRDELKYEDGFERHTTFHGTDDLISINDLWHHWIRSAVYNWTVDDVLEWLVEDVELPKYIEAFKVNAVDGRTLPRIAANGQYTANILNIKNIIHKQKLSLKAMDAVLFGPPKKGHSYLKDLALVASLVIAVGGCWLAYVQHRYSSSHLKKVMKDLDTLQRSEDALKNLQTRLQIAEEEQRSVLEEKSTLEAKMKNEIKSAKNEAEKLRNRREATEEEISRLQLAEEELAQVRTALRRAERELEDRQNAPLAELQQWLQLTYEMETKHYEVKREAVERQLSSAKDMCEKIRKKRGAFLGSFRIAHTTSIDDTDHKIMSARAALEDIKLDLQERMNRWHQIEKICGFNITTNPGLPYLTSLLKGSSGSNLLSSQQLGGSMMPPVDIDNADEDLPPGYFTAAALPSVGLVDRRQTSLASAFGSSGSLNTNSHTHLVSHVRSGVLETIPAHKGSDSDSVAESESSSRGSRHAANGGTVEFDLGGDSSPMKASANEASESQRNFHKSVSLDPSSSRPLNKAKSLPYSLSESAITGMRRQPGVIKRAPATSSSCVPEEDNSSPESTDSASAAGDEKVKKRKKKGKLFRKILGKDMDKTKVT